MNGQYPESGVMTVTAGGNVPVSGTGYWPNTDNLYWPYHNYYVHTVEDPKFCIGKAHVFECDHVEKCQCGKIQRVMPRESKAKAKK